MALFKNRFERLHLVLIALCCLLSSGCQKQDVPLDKVTNPQTQAQWQDHLVEYSQGWIPAEGLLNIRFSHPVIAANLLNKPLDGIIKLQPDSLQAELEVAAVFTAENKLEMRHQKPFPSGQTLVVNLLPEKLANLPANLAPFRLDIKVLEQSMNLREIGLRSDRKTADTMLLDGELETTDSALANLVEQTLKATQAGNALKISWQHADARKHQFTVEGITRQAAPSQLLISWDGAPIKLNNKGQRQVEIPAASQFTVTSTRAVIQPNTYIEVHFSDSLDARQNLEGLVRLNGRDARTQIDGTILRVYSSEQGGSEKMQGDQQLHIEATLRSAQKKPLGIALDKSVSFIPELPAVRFAEKGDIMPPADKLTIAIETVAINAIKVRAFEIYPNNIGQYLQQNDFSYKSGGYFYNGTHRDEGRYLWQKTIALPKNPQLDWTRYDLDVSELVANKKGSLLRLELEVLPQFSAYPCEAPPKAVVEEDISKKNYEGFERQDPIPERLRQFYESEGYYDWSERKNPCSPSYFSSSSNETHVVQTFFASNIGLLAKQGGDNQLHVLATNLRDATPLAGADISVFNYQQQLIGSGKSAADGLLTVEVQGVPYYVSAQKEGDTNYLKVPRNNALPTSQFNTGGTTPQQGLKGFFYGERDIWRPGDDIFLTFILLDRDKALPANYPLTLEFFDPRGGKVSSITNTQPTDNFYTFNLKTMENAPTGNWRAIVKVGDNYFDRIIKVENISPNRLKMDLALPPEGLHPDQLPLKTTLQAQWLTGATAATLKADVQVKLSAIKTVFSGFEGYTFDDKARSFTQEPQKVFEGFLDNSGKTDFTAKFDITSAPPGMLNATFTERVFEPGGQFSSQYRSSPVYPFTTWVGFHAPLGNQDYYGALDKDAEHPFDLVTLDSHGRAIANHKLNVTLYAIEWHWWWDEKEENFANYLSNSVHAPKETTTVTTDADGHTHWTLVGKKYHWGRYLVRVCDAEIADATQYDTKQHCASQDIYLGWGWGEQAGQDAATRMSLSSDRDHYQVGDGASIHLPEGPDRQVLVSIENGNRVLSRYWQAIKSGENNFTLPITAEMTPNVYVHITALQPHQQRNNDLPIRLYGVLPLLVDDPATHLTPTIVAPLQVRPESKLALKVAEQQGRAMTYTVALVDEGLLGITDFTAPDPHNSFYKREALGVLTWDMFDQVVGAYSAELSRLLSIGGGDSIKKRDSNRERRFPPIVRFLGAFHLAAGATREHTIDLPAYMGAVRVMVVAGDGRAFGRAEQSVKVTQPLTLLSTLPRVLGPGEEVDLPVNVFVSEAPTGKAIVGEAKISVVTDEFFTALTSDQRLAFTKPGEAMAHLRLKVNDRVGMAAVTVKAQLGTETAQEVIHIPVRSANLPSTKTESHLLQPQEQWSPTLAVHGMLGTNSTTLTVSSMPELKLEERLQYLIDYPNGCIEQTISAVFPQLYLPSLVELNAAQTRDIEHNINAAIGRLASFQTSSGGFAYWPYQNDVNPWGNNYAGHFLLEAKQLGYSIPPSLLSNWLQYQHEQARSSNANSYAGDAYRLYTLALAGQTDAGAMNRLREKLKTFPANQLVLDRWMLALAYQQIGQQDIAAELLSEAGTTSAYHPAYDWTYGSALRDRAVLLLLQQNLGRTEIAWLLGTDIANDLARDEWYSTQTTAWALLALAHSFGSQTRQTQFALLQGSAQQGDPSTQVSKWQDLATAKPVFRQSMPDYQPGQMIVRNDSDHPLYAAVANRGTPANTTEQAESTGLSLDVRFTDVGGRLLSVHSLPSGQDFIAEVTIKNTGDRALENLALTEVVPSGWQIRNTRLEGVEENNELEYQDIRDDRLVSYFSLQSPTAPADNNNWWRPKRVLRDTVVVKMLLNASFAGRFYLPGWQVEPMYDGSRHASSAGQWVEVIAQ